MRGKEGQREVQRLDEGHVTRQGEKQRLRTLAADSQVPTPQMSLKNDAHSFFSPPSAPLTVNICPLFPDQVLLLGLAKLGPLLGGLTGIHFDNLLPFFLKTA